MVDTTKVLKASDIDDQPFVMPEHVQQVFYVVDEMDPKFGVVLDHAPRRWQNIIAMEADIMDLSLTRDFSCPVMLPYDSIDNYERARKGGIHVVVAEHQTQKAHSNDALDEGKEIIPFCFNAH
ncbi:hypothetical protein O6H91_Y108600 [Diphasiastrum complanatum]|nr:hypothetical protein O6H91_Y108600 [Diphasiastrum complanatum]